MNLCQWEFDLTLYDSSSKYIATRVLNTSISQENVTENCSLLLQLSANTYRKIDSNKLFNLKPEFRGPLSSGDFLADKDIQLEITLKPDLLPQLLQHATDSVSVANYLSSLNHQSAPNQSSIQDDDEATAPSTAELLLDPDNWFALNVKQIREDGETGYTTLWNYVNPAILNHPETAGEQIAEGVINFAKNWIDNDFAETAQELTEELLNAINNLFDGADTWLDEALESINPNGSNQNDHTSILETAITFFTKDDWTFTKLQGQSVLQMTFQGEHGLWNCYAQAREAEEQYIFYSIYPEVVPDNMRLAVAEFLTRLNYGLVIGNFELDLNDGDIRYKTSIDLDSKSLTPKIIQRLVYANIAIMDHHFLSIQAVMTGTTPPENAIAQIAAT